ncbi:arylamine N-acetyltransferase [Phenylobacterium sp.]|uniref:arylamine N-acetyltransferase family protein n=1 Tax=Phenylobacterium sp. TaxID=1871053 RepID=UPI00286C1629|nr:arylamine N-acetyltransferase [Phenylobacterium sp.]
MTDLTAYFTRIGYDGPREPTLAVLRDLLVLHTASIPFEAIDVLQDRGVDLAPEIVDAKLIDARRGGYCYEQNGLFKRVLTALGFEVEGRIARVRWNLPAGELLRPPTHMVLRVKIDGVAWLCDVGFGSCVPTAPLRWDLREPQRTGHEDFRLTDIGGDLLMEARLGEDWTPVYQVAPDVLLDQDYEINNWFSSTHPSSHFRHVLIVALTKPDARYVLAQNRLTVRRPSGEMERTMLDAEGLEHVLATTFGLPVSDDWRPLLERVAAAS